jgi:hypothetical protein
MMNPTYLAIGLVARCVLHAVAPGFRVDGT